MLKFTIYANSCFRFNDASREFFSQLVAFRRDGLRLKFCWCVFPNNILHVLLFWFVNIFDVDDLKCVWSQISILMIRGEHN